MTKQIKIVNRKSNVLGKIIIPKTEQTIRYILAELEELEREEFFRLKKVLEVKYRHKKKKVECPLCKAEAEEAAELKRLAEMKRRPMCVICHGPMKSDPARIVKEAAKRAELEDQLEKIIVIIQEYDQKGIKSPTVDEFKEVAEELREKLKAGDSLPEDTDVTKLCDACRARFKVVLPPTLPVIDFEKVGDGVCHKCEKHSVGPGDECAVCEKHSVGPMSVQISLPSPAISKSCEICKLSKEESSSSCEICKSSEKETSKECKPVTPPRAKSKDSEKSVRLPDSSSVCEKHTPQPDLELGVFETDVKEIVKIVRKRNDDGTLTEEKMVITIKKETRNPGGESATSSNVAYQSSDTSEDSNCCHRTVGMLTIPEARKLGFDVGLRRVSSYYSQPDSPVNDRLDRYCMSTCSVMSIDSEFAQQLQDKTKPTEYKVTSPSNTSNPYSNKNTIGVVTTADPKKLFRVLLKEVDSCYPPNDSMIAKTSLCSNSRTHIDKMLEQNLMKLKDSTSILDKIYFNSNNNNIFVDSNADPKERRFEELASHINSGYLPLATTVLDSVHESNLATASMASIVCKIEKLTEQYNIDKVTEFLKVKSTSGIEVQLSEEIVDKTEHKKSSVEMQYVNKSEVVLDNNEDELKEKNQTEIAVKVEFEKPKKLSVKSSHEHNKCQMEELNQNLSEVMEIEITSSHPLAEYETREPEKHGKLYQGGIFKSNSIKNNYILGVHKTDIKEIVKVVRTKNKEGILTDERKVIQLKKETRYPSKSKANNDSNVHDDKICSKISETSVEPNQYRLNPLGMTTSFEPKKQHIMIGQREVKSHFTPFSLPMANTLTRSCMSSTSVMSIDSEFEAVCKCIIINPDCNEDADISSDLRAYVTSSTEFDQILDSFEPNPGISTEAASTSRNCKETVCGSTLTNSDYMMSSDNFIKKNERDSE